MLSHSRVHGAARGSSCVCRGTVLHQIPERQRCSSGVLSGQKGSLGGHAVLLCLDEGVLALKRTWP